MRPCSNFWIEKDGKVVLSEWRVELLEAVEQTGSINAAAAQQGVPFASPGGNPGNRRRSGGPLDRADDGRPRGGGTRLTAEGRAYIAQFMPRWPGSKIAPSGNFAPFLVKTKGFFSDALC